MIAQAAEYDFASSYLVQKDNKDSVCSRLDHSHSASLKLALIELMSYCSMFVSGQKVELLYFILSNSYGKYCTSPGRV